MSNKRHAKSAPPPRKAHTESPWPKRLAVIGGFIVVVGLVAVVLFSQPALRGIPEGTEAQAVGDPAHVDGEIHADGEVPAGGAHNEIWQNCGFYDEEVESEHVVHSLEHGAVWIAYDPALSSSEIDVLRGFVSPSEKVVVSPVHGQPAPVIATAWGQQLELDSSDDARLGQFVNEFAGASSAPEPGASCSGGIGHPQF
ncbi:MAG: DUF3105 domain-containing protein [Actinomycetota bacterium]